MIENSKLFALAVSCLLIGMLAGYLLEADPKFDDGGGYNDNTRYWFYLDYGSYETSELQSGWVEGEAPYRQPLRALDSVADMTVGPEGELLSVNGITPDTDLTGERWVVWLAPFPTPDGLKWIAAGTDLESLLGLYTFYIGITDFHSVTKAPINDPNTMSIWFGDGQLTSRPAAAVSASAFENMPSARYPY